MRIVRSIETKQEKQQQLSAFTFCTYERYTQDRNQKLNVVKQSDDRRESSIFGLMHAHTHTHTRSLFANRCILFCIAFITAGGGVVGGVSRWFSFLLLFFFVLFSSIFAASIVCGACAILCHLRLHEFWFYKFAFPVCEYKFVSDCMCVFVCVCFCISLELHTPNIYILCCVIYNCFFCLSLSLFFALFSFFFVLVKFVYRY